jgi:hypothetical protein
MVFGISMSSFFGTSGEFRIEGKHGVVVARYVQTRIRAAADGNWDSILTQYMKPWREVFSTEKMSFDELLQRDLDDARVANELIPYLMGAESSKYPVFPPILAVLTPKTAGSDGIESYYPKPSDIERGRKYGDVFEYSDLWVDGQQTPIAKIDYNPHKSAFVIVDGQHRAMALLALYRQLGGSSQWGANPYASYYSHLKPTPSQISHIQLPVCVLYFPELYEGSEETRQTDSDLIGVCRQIFLDVNKQAKKVSRARELLLDDTSFPPILMRRVLTELKRQDDGLEKSRIYAFDYGRDEASDSDRVVVVNQTEYSSSHALHIIMGSLCFANPDTLPLNSSTDVTDGRHRRNSGRPAQLLCGLELSPRFKQNISVKNAALVGKDERELIVQSLFELWKPVVPAMFNELRPYRSHNKALYLIRKELSTANAIANSSLNEARSLIFDGGAGRAVFFRHSKRLEKYIESEDFSEFRSKEVIESNLEHCKSVQSALQNQESDFRRKRAYIFWGVKEGQFALDSDEFAKFIKKSDMMFAAFRTQALQLGFAMLNSSIVDYLYRDGAEASETATHEELRMVVDFSAELTLSVVNHFFSPAEDVERRSLNQGYFSESRSNVFIPNAIGLRGLYSTTKGRELNERAWRFFRYAFAEILFCQFTREIHKSILDKAHSETRTLYLKVLPKILNDLEEEREHWRSRFIDAGLSSPAFKAQKQQRRMELGVEAKTEEEIQTELNEMEDEERDKMDKLARDHLKASIGVPDDSTTILDAFTLDS